MPMMPLEPLLLVTTAVEPVVESGGLVGVASLALGLMYKIHTDARSERSEERSVREREAEANAKASAAVSQSLAAMERAMNLLERVR